MSEICKLKTGSPYEERGSYSRAVQAGEFIFVSNTAGRDPETKVLADDPVAQTNQALDNIERALQALGASLEDVVKACIFIQNRSDVYPIMDAYGARMKGIDPALTMFTPPLSSDDYRVEIEVTALTDASKSAQRRIEI